jgi:hypothetical protein
MEGVYTPRQFFIKISSRAFTFKIGKRFLSTKKIWGGRGEWSPIILHIMECYSRSGGKEEDRPTREKAFCLSI